MPYIYKITNNINGKIYVGKTNFSIEKRWKEHLRDYSKERCENRPLYSAMKKYGVENFFIEEIEKCSIDEVNEREVYWIEYYGSFKYGYNATKGGDGKSYIDYELVINLYKKGNTQKEIAKLLHISQSTVQKIIKNSDFKPRLSKDVIKQKYGVKVICKDKTTKKNIKAFSSYSEAAQWLIDNNLTNCKKNTIRTHISEVCNKKRKTAANFIWELI